MSRNRIPQGSVLTECPFIVCSTVAVTEEDKESFPGWQIAC